ncbi:hypothetical protein [Variovorax boronicumulans]|uniref:hypothetical protein n=1 Tax=Variovorax boronicumulans TaxID=436515 RepID=UPI00278072CB|nr:hypothetical protein [Variovorax boronicumulans]MDQ0040851.1 hypothetical protein [Variovorax boronicumulans]
MPTLRRSNLSGLPLVIVRNSVRLLLLNHRHEPLSSIWDDFVELLQSRWRRKRSRPLLLLLVRDLYLRDAE